MPFLRRCEARSQPALHIARCTAHARALFAGVGHTTRKQRTETKMREVRRTDPDTKSGTDLRVAAAVVHNISSILVVGNIAYLCPHM